MHPDSMQNDCTNHLTQQNQSLPSVCQVPHVSSSVNTNNLTCLVAFLYKLKQRTKYNNRNHRFWSLYYYTVRQNSWSGKLRNSYSSKSLSCKSSYDKASMTWNSKSYWNIQFARQYTTTIHGARVVRNRHSYIQHRIKKQSEQWPCLPTVDNSRQDDMDQCHHHTYMR